MKALDFKSCHFDHDYTRWKVLKLRSQIQLSSITFPKMGHRNSVLVWTYYDGQLQLSTNSFLVWTYYHELIINFRQRKAIANLWQIQGSILYQYLFKFTPFIKTIQTLAIIRTPDLMISRWWKCKSYISTQFLKHVKTCLFSWFIELIMLFSPCHHPPTKLF